MQEQSSIDGLYGKGTASALVEYNKQNLNGADLKKSENVEKLFNVVLGLKPVPKIIPKTQSDGTKNGKDNYPNPTSKPSLLESIEVDTKGKQK